MQSICFVSNKYPNCIDHNGLVFVQQLVWSIADEGIKCTVICPLAANLYPRMLSVPDKVTEKTENGNEVSVYFPKFFGLGQSHYILGKSPIPFTTNRFTHTVLKTIKKNGIEFDAIYGHFAAPAGVCAARIGTKTGKPSFMAHGESTAWSIEQFGEDKIRDELSSLTGVIAVSTRNKNLLIEKETVPEQKIKVFPNGYRPERFYRRDKTEARKRFGWDKDAFIAGFCGSFDERKGILRLQKAADSTEGVFFACAGKGKLNPDSSKCVWAKPVNNNELAWFYSAVDVFCLPTQQEGCCNAIVEAIACGCPIISSDRSFNYDICDETNSILIDPDDTEAIKDAICELKENPEKRARLSEGSLEKAKQLTLQNRARNIISYMNRSIVHE